MTVLKDFRMSYHLLNGLASTIQIILSSCQDRLERTSRQIRI
jgi:hypothetical protein